MQVKSLRTHPYAGKYHPKGSTYEIKNKSHLKILIAVKAIAFSQKPDKTENAGVVDTSGKNEPLHTPECLSFSEKKQSKGQRRKYRRKEKRLYDRKDMQAESFSSE